MQKITNKEIREQRKELEILNKAIKQSEKERKEQEAKDKYWWKLRRELTPELIKTMPVRFVRKYLLRTLQEDKDREQQERARTKGTEEYNQAQIENKREQREKIQRIRKEIRERKERTGR